MALCRRLVVTAASLFAAHCATAARPAESAFGGGFQLEDATSRVVTDQAFRGRFLLIMFGYTNCPDFCPTALYSIAGAMRIMGGRAGAVQPLFITVDPARDTPKIIGRYVALFSPAITGLSGTVSQLQQVEREYHVYVGATDPKTGAITHSDLLYFVGPDGKFITALSANMSADGLATRLTRLISG